MKRLIAAGAIRKLPVANLVMLVARCGEGRVVAVGTGIDNVLVEAELRVGIAKRAGTEVPS